MTEIAILARGLGKRFSLGELEPYRTLRDGIARVAGAPLRALRGRSERRGAQTLWALRDVSFELRRGEVLGVIGRNGAGKSTLLRLLARITEPSEGRAELRGRVGSLLEVGTGFHPELTGRENVYLNGALLGMRRAETRARFDEIVAFSEVERFLDTPVKRYSSGMRMRLAFSVAAHLESDILLVDEVLAVGDASFQRKCLGKMNHAARAGRTVVFVSHDMNAVGRLCSRALLLDAGRIAEEGTPRDVIRSHLERSRGAVSSLERAPGCYALEGASRDGVENRGREVVLRAVRLRDGEGELSNVVASGDPLVVEIDYRAREPLARPTFGVIVSKAETGRVALLQTLLQHGPLEALPSEGSLRCTVSRLPLAPGSYTLSLGLSVRGEQLDWVEHCIVLEVQPGDYYGTGFLPKAEHGLVLLDARWELPC